MSTKRPAKAPLIQGGVCCEQVEEFARKAEKIASQKIFFQLPFHADNFLLRTFACHGKRGRVLGYK